MVTCLCEVGLGCGAFPWIGGAQQEKQMVHYHYRHVVVVVDPTPPTCCQQSPAPESCGSQQSLPPGGKERLHFVGIRPEVQARKGGW